MRDWLTKQDPIVVVYGLLVALAAGVAAEAYRLGLGQLRSPGPGFTYFWTAVALGLLSIRLLAKALRATGLQDTATWKGKHWGKAMLAVAALVAYALSFEKAGYLLTTFVFTGFLFWMLRDGEPNWPAILGGALLASVITYVVFDRWFSLQLPKGPIRLF